MPKRTDLSTILIIGAWAGQAVTPRLDGDRPAAPAPAGRRPAWTRRACAPMVRAMNIKVVVHEAEEGGFWAEVPALPGCASQGETTDELVGNIREAIAGWLSADVPAAVRDGRERVLDLAL